MKGPPRNASSTLLEEVRKSLPLYGPDNCLRQPREFRTGCAPFPLHTLPTPCSSLAISSPRDPQGSRLSCLARLWLGNKETRAAGGGWPGSLPVSWHSGLPCVGTIYSFLSLAHETPAPRESSTKVPQIKKLKVCPAWVDAGREEREDGVSGGDYMLKFRSFSNGFSFSTRRVTLMEKRKKNQKVNNDGISVTSRYSG